jgi:hypothetical protein
MRKLALALPAAVAAVLVAVSLSAGSSHREAANTARAFGGRVRFSHFPIAGLCPNGARDTLRPPAG